MDSIQDLQASINQRIEQAQGYLNEAERLFKSLGIEMKVELGSESFNPGVSRQQAKPTPPTLKKGGNNDRREASRRGASLYWVKVNQIAAEHNCSISEARVLYSSDKIRGKNPSNNGIPSASATKNAARRRSPRYKIVQRQAQRRYWGNIQRIQQEQNCSLEAAREIWRNRHNNPAAAGMMPGTPPETAGSIG